jgi:hypothetical protein
MSSPVSGFALSDDSLTGNLDPVTVELSGYDMSDNLTARTDTGTNTKTNLTIDDGDGWFASEAQIELTNLRKLYAFNGTFEDGTSPWFNTSTNTGGVGQTQNATWNQAGEYITVENNGEYDTHPQLGDHYEHYVGTRILWNQTIDNTPYSTNFSLSFEFMYASGPIDPGILLSGDARLVIFIHSDVYILSLLDLDARDIWYTIRDFAIDLPSAPASFDISVGIRIDIANIVVYADTDYDEDGYADGAANAEKIEVFFDDISLVSVDPVDYEEVDLTFHAGVISDAIVASGPMGMATITNPTFWTQSPLQVEVTSNNTVTFDYRVRLFIHQYTNSSWTADPTKHGVSFILSSNESASLSLFTYVGTSNGFENQSIDVHHPWDWENATVLDPLLTDVTGLCDLSAGLIEIPNSLLDRVGWWEIRLDAPNYVKSSSVQLLNSSSGTWAQNSVFRAGNQTRVQSEIGTTLTVPAPTNPVNFTLSLPNGTIWTFDSASGMVSGNVNSTAWTLGATNTSAGQWMIEIAWTNGSEVAYESISFSMYHATTLTPLQTLVETDSGLVITNMLYYVDTDSGEYLVDGIATIQGNWSATTVSFGPNFVRNWWEADFDTSIVGAGHFVVVVNATRPYFDDASCLFSITSIHVTDLSLPGVGAVPVEMGLNGNITVSVEHELLNGSGVGGSTIQAQYSGPSSGLSFANDTDFANGTYTITVASSKSGTYTVTISATKAFHWESSETFTIIVGEIHTQLSVVNGTSGFVRMGDSYKLVVEYANETGFGLVGATVEVVDITPSIGISYENSTDDGGGYYSIILTPSSARPFTIVVKANLTNHVTQISTFTLTSTEIPTVLNVDNSGASVSVDQNYTVQITFRDDLGAGLDGAQILVINPPIGLGYSSALGLSNGLYNITLMPTEIGTYQIAFRAALSNYQNSTIGFTLIVTAIPTQLDISSGDTGSTQYSSVLTLVLTYSRTDYPQNISSADLQVSFTPDDNLNYTVEETGSLYYLRIRAQIVGLWQVSVTANKSNHISAFVQFEFEVVSIGTSINDILLLEPLIFGRTYNFTFNYIMFNNTGVTLAAVSHSGSAAQWMTHDEQSAGLYVVHLIPQEVGQYELELDFSKYGFESGSTSLLFQVNPVVVEVIDIHGLDSLEGQGATVTLRVVESDTGDSVTGAIVEFQLITDTGLGELQPMEETEAGLYSADIIMPAADTTTSLRVYVSLEHHDMTLGYHDENIVPSVDQLSMIRRTIDRNLIPIGILVVCVVGYAGRSRYTRRQRMRYIEAMEIKRRFDEVQSLFGVVVLHKNTGIPIYSKMVRSGMDETMVSGFITAVTQFRSEFAVSQEDWCVTPISDIIRAVATENLICAFITLGAPTENQEKKMLEFAETTGFVFDGQFTEPPIRVIEGGTLAQFEALFDEVLDGRLLKYYTIVESRWMPRSKCVKERVEILSEAGEFELEVLAKGLTACGLEEARVYDLIMTAIEREQIALASREKESDFGLDFL